MISQFNTYQFGVTLVVIGLSATVQLNCQTYKSCNGGFIKIHSGGGTLAMVNGASNISTQGYLMGATETLRFEGPANFFLAASGATMTVSLVTSLSQGFSTTPPVA